jgi:hypothetical protein
MNRILVRNANKYHVVPVGTGSLLELHAKSVNALMTGDTKPTLVNQQHIPNVENPCMAMNTRAGFKFISNYFINGLKFRHMNEPASTNAVGELL